MTVITQKYIAVIISFSFYFIWAWFANSLATNDQGILLKSALVQSSYSAFMTLSFTSLLTWVIEKMKCQHYPFLAILPPLSIQSTIVYFINYFNDTPNIILTIAPSIFFTALYGGVFAYSLLKKPEYQCSAENEYIQR